MDFRDLPLVPDKNAIQTISVVTDVIDNCNHACTYCHPMEAGKWGKQMLSAEHIGEIFRASEDAGALEVLLTGGEITMHPEFDRIMDHTRDLEHTVASIVTNATLISPDQLDAIHNSGIARICVSVDGSEASTHDSRRGQGKFAKAMQGLYALQQANRPITVISVLDRRTYPRILQLSWMLADQGLADQHHMCAPSYSGSARRGYGEYALALSDYHKVQALVDESYNGLLKAGLYVTFNSFWPATGEHGASEQPRTLTLSQARERTKDLYAIVRPNGDVRTTAAAWGRETVGNAVVGNLGEESASTLLGRADTAYRAGYIRQLPRQVEAGSKFQVGPYAGRAATDALISTRIAPLENLDLMVPTQPIRALSENDMLANPFGSMNIAHLAWQIAACPDQWRVVAHASGIDLVFNRRTSHVTLLKADETKALLSEYYAHRYARIG
ncbi:MAG TPA: radical SAM protein [Streptosporangiaceae bacterium]|nr:radical SAM protein [Streptosporangiaceae bacterium]